VPLSTRRLFSALVALILIAIVFAYGQFGVATESIQFDLRKIGESIYEARAKTGRWPMQAADLEGTEYLRMPHRKIVLAERVYVIVWQDDLDQRPEANRDRILAYDNRSLLTRFGIVWACRGDLRIDRLSSEEIAAVKRSSR
jgi:hypothetical protein